MKKCKTCRQAIKPTPRKEVVTVEGISYTIHHWPDGGGRTVETPCKCCGFSPSTHSTDKCPWMKKRTGRDYPWRDAS